MVKILDSEKLKIEISNIGATLDKIEIKEYNTSLPLVGITGISGYEKTPFVLDQSGESEIKYVYENNDVKIIKTYTIEEGDYIIESGIIFYNKSNMSKLIEFDIKSCSIEMSSLDKKANGFDRTIVRDKSLNEYVINFEKGMHRKAGSE